MKVDLRLGLVFEPCNLWENRQCESFQQRQGRSVGCGPGLVLSQPQARALEASTD